MFLRDAEKYGLKGPFLGTRRTMDLKDLAGSHRQHDGGRRTFYVRRSSRARSHADMQKYTDTTRSTSPTTSCIVVTFYGMSGA